VNKDSLFADGYTWLALAKLNKGEVDSILVLTGKSIRLAPELALNYQILAWYSNGHLKDEAKALEYIDKAISLDPGNPDPLVSKAGFQFLKSNFLEQLSLLGQALKKEPSEFYPDLLHSIGAAYLSISEFDLSEIFLNKAVQLQPDDLTVLKDLAFVHMLKGDDERYYQVIQKIQEIRKDNYGLEASGRYFLLKGNYAEAEKYYSQYFSLTSEKVYFVHERSAYAVVLRKLGKEKEALKQIYEALDWIEKNFPTDPGYDLAKVYSFLGEKEKALDHLSRWKPLWGLYYYIERDPLFENIRNEPEFKRQVMRIRAEFDDLKKQAHARIKSGEFPSPEMIR
jgi:tetratricopeptide (TPR) repeat protein